MPPSTKQSTESLLQRVRQGSPSAMNRLFASCRPVLLRRTKARSPGSFGRNQDSSDLVQECLFLAVARFGEFRGQSLPEFRKWLASILEHQILHRRRFWCQKKRDRKREQPLETVGGGMAEPAGSTTSILGRLVRHEETERVKVAMGWCRQADQQVISLHLDQDLDYEEIAVQWGVEAAVIRQRYSRAIRRLGEATRLQALMTRRGVPLQQQDVVGIHYFQRVHAATIADCLVLPERLVERWLAEAGPLIREFEQGKS